MAESPTAEAEIRQPACTESESEPQFDAKQAARQIALVKAQEKANRRIIPFAILVTRTNPAITPQTLKHILQRFEELAIPVLQTRLYDREAYRAIFSYGGTLQGLPQKGYSNVTTAISNAAEFAGEVVQRLRDARGPAAREVA